MKIVSAIVVIVVLAGAGTWYARTRPAPERGAQGITPSTKPVLGVEDLMKHVDQHVGPVVVEGVMSAASPKDQLLSLVDRHEFEECGLVGCAAYVLPVRWTGTMPAVKNIVRVKGEVKKDDGGKLAFFASAVEDIKPAVEGEKEGKEK